MAFDRSTVAEMSGATGRTDQDTQALSCFEETLLFAASKRKVAASIEHANDGTIVADLGCISFVRESKARQMPARCASAKCIAQRP